MVELDEKLKLIADLMNCSYEAAFPNYPSTPKFSFARAMVVIWKDSVYDKVKELMNYAVMDLLKTEHNKLVLKGKELTEKEKKKGQAKVSVECELMQMMTECCGEITLQSCTKSVEMNLVSLYYYSWTHFILDMFKQLSTSQSMSYPFIIWAVQKWP